MTINESCGIYVFAAITIKYKVYKFFQSYSKVDAIYLVINLPLDN